MESIYEILRAPRRRWTLAVRLHGALPMQNKTLQNDATIRPVRPGEPGVGQTAIHHHGKQDRVVYVLGGTALLRWGPRGQFSATAAPGDFVYVQAYLPYKEINLSEETDFRWVVVRSTPRPIVVNLPDDYWSGSNDDDGADQPDRLAGRSLAGF
jgi:mannose-6-phosphate isomerase-like protein (cupin superfamily)